MQSDVTTNYKNHAFSKLKQQQNHSATLIFQPLLRLWICSRHWITLYSHFERMFSLVHTIYGISRHNLLLMLPILLRSLIKDPMFYCFFSWIFFFFSVNQKLRFNSPGDPKVTEMLKKYELFAKFCHRKVCKRGKFPNENINLDITLTLILPLVTRVVL